jgi:DNA-binding transcriptional regulator PaaX
VRDVEREILRILSKSELSLTPSNIAKNTGYSGGYIRKECNRMAKQGLLQKDDAGTNPFYSISDRGRAYLEGELDQDEFDSEE